MAQSLTQQLVAWVRTKDADEAYDYRDPWGCPFFLFLKEAGYPVVSVDPDVWEDVDGHEHDLPDGLDEALSPADIDALHTFGALLTRLEALS